MNIFGGMLLTMFEVYCGVLQKSYVLHNCTEKLYVTRGTQNTSRLD